MGRRTEAQVKKKAAGGPEGSASRPVASPPAGRYAPSWFNRVLGVCGRLPVPAWTVYIGWLVLQGLLAHVAAWNEGLLPAGTLNPLLLFCGIWSAEVFLFSHYLDVIARDSLVRYRPMLNTLSGAEFDRIEYEFTTMPRRPVLWVSVVGFAAGIVMANAAKSYQPLMFAWPLLAYLFWGISWLGLGVFCYRLVRQLRFASRIYALTKKINLYHLRPLYALSRLAVWTSVSVVIIIDLNILLLTPQLMVTSAFILLFVLAMLLSLATFLLPLYGIKRRILAERNQLMEATAREIEIAYERLANAIRTGDSKKLADVRIILDLVHRKKDFVHSIPVWPWNPGTFTALASAVVLPVILGILSRIILRVLGL